MAAVNRALVAARDVSAVLDEEWPTGTYGDRRPGPCPHPNPNAAAHRQALAVALSDWTCGTTTELRYRATPAQPITEKRKS